MLTCFICKKQIKTPTLAIKITQKDNPKRVEYLHQKCLNRARENATNEYIEKIINKFMKGD